MNKKVSGSEEVQLRSKDVLSSARVERAGSCTDRGSCSYREESARGDVGDMALVN